MSPDGMSINSGADLVASVPADIFSSIDNAAETPEAPETGEIETPAEEPVDTGDEPQAEEAPAEEPAEDPTEEPEPAVEEPAAEDLPDGVRRGKDRNGKDGLFVEPKRWDTIYGNHKAIQQYSEMLGEPLTKDSLDVRHRAYLGQEKLYGDLLSADPTSQAAVLNHFLDEGSRALQSGEVGADPIISLADTFYQTLQEKHPDAYAGLRHRAASDLIKELYGEAQTSKSQDLYRSAGWIAQALGLPHKNEGEMKAWLSSSPAENPVVGLQQKIQQLEQQLNGKQVDTQAAQLEQWQAATRQAVSSAVLDKAVKPALAEYQIGLWEKQPESFQRLVTDPLHREVKSAVLKDKGFNDRIAMLETAAKRASAQRRTAITAEIEQAYVNRARLAADALRPRLLKEAAAAIKGQSDATHKRLSDAQNQRGPKGAANPVPRSIVPSNLLPEPGGDFDPATEARRAMALIGQ